MTESLPDKPSRSREEIILAIRSALQLVPCGIGAALEVQIFDRLAARQRERMRDFVESLSQQLTALAERMPDFIRLELLDTDEFRFILTEVLTRAAREHREEKIRCFRAVLVNSMGHDPREDFDRKAFFLSTLEALTTDDLRVLQSVRQHSRIDLGTLYDQLGANESVDKQYVQASVNVLAGQGLLVQGPTLAHDLVDVSEGETPVIREPRPWERWALVNELGEQFLRFITAPEPGDPREA